MKRFFRFLPSGRSARGTGRGWGLTPCAFRFLLVGHVLILLALGDFAARLHGGEVETLLYIGEFMRSVAMAFMVVWGVGLGLDYWGRR